MIIVMKQNSSEEQVGEVISLIEKLGYKAHLSRGVERTIIGVIGHKDKSAIQSFASLDSVESVIPILKPFKIASREMHLEPTVVDVGGVKIGGERITVIAGPCSVESEEQIVRIAHAVKDAGAQMLRGGAYKPRTSPYAFQGLEEEGLKYLARAKKETGLKIVTEIVAIGDTDVLVKYVDMIQIGARNCQNFALLKAVGQSGMPVILKRGMATTIKEFIQAAEYILSEGNPNVVLCERGVRTFEDSTRNTLDLSAVALIKEWSHLPVIVDPSHGTGVRELVTPMSRAAIAAGADGLIIEVHDHPEEAFSDGPQSLKPDQFRECLKEMAKIAAAMGRTV
ncbi:MAG: 3-deoxy-7-phosphoheptulonate synthase [Candidatus Latescibacteria bacterium]|nr:3-deoxy-7-phosphoheptulonate synthase [Candidatus Latescibacterota bacterium]